MFEYVGECAAYWLWSCISAAGTQRPGSARAPQSAAWSWLRGQTCPAGTPRLSPECSNKRGPRTHWHWRGFSHLGEVQQNVINLTELQLRKHILNIWNMDDEGSWGLLRLPWCLSFWNLTYVDGSSTVVSRRQNRLYATFLGVRPVDSVTVAEVDWQASGPTQAIGHQDFPLLAIQPRTLDLCCVSTVRPVQHPTETQQRLQLWSLSCCGLRCLPLGFPWQITAPTNHFCCNVNVNFSNREFPWKKENTKMTAIGLRETQP